jgi:PAS domain S-box-containing protein
MKSSMNDHGKTNQQLLAELEQARRQIAAYERADAGGAIDGHTVGRFFELSLDLCAIAGYDGYYRRVNSAFERVLGYTVEESLSRPFMDFIHPDDRQSATEQMQKLLAGDPVVHFEDRNVCKNGSYRWLEWTVTPLPDRDLVFGIGRDVTRHKEMEQALRQAGDQQELRVKQRTTDLAAVNEQLHHEVEVRRQAEGSLRAALAELGQFHSIVSQSPVVVFSARPLDNWRIDFVSDNVEQCGYTAEELMSGRVAWSEIVHPEDWQRLQEEVEGHLKAGRLAFRQDYRVIDKSGRVRFVEDWNQVVADSRGNSAQVHGILLDVTDRKRAEQARRSSEERYRALLTGVPDMIFRIAADGTFLDFSPGYGMTPYVPPGEFLGKRIGQVLPEDVAVPLGGLVEEVIETRQMRLSEYRLCMEGEWRDHEARLVAGARDEVIAVVRDITESKRIEEALQRSLRLASLGTLAAGIAHEINNPLAAALTAAETAQDVFGDPQAARVVRDCLENVVTSARRCAEIVRSVLKFARQEPHEKKPCRLSECLNNVTFFMREYMKKHDARVTIDTPTDPCPVRMNPLEIEQVIVNLLQNAALASAGPVDVRVSTHWRDGSVRIAVTDNGCGMADEQKARIFDPFYTTRPDAGGTGLGLSIAYGIVHDHGGSMEVDSAVGQGTTIWVELPLARDDQSP